MNSHFLSVAKGTLVISFGILIENLLRLPLGIILARYLGPEELGRYHLTVSIVLVLSAFAMLGAGISLVRFIPFYHGRNDGEGLLGLLRLAFIIPFCLSVLGGVGLFVFGPIIASSFFHDADLSPMLRVAAFFLPGWVLATVGGAALRGYQKMYHFTLSKKIILPSARFVFVICLAMTSLLSARTAVWSFGLALFVSAIFSLYFIRKLIYPKLINISARYDHAMLARFAVPGFAAQLIVFAGPSIKLLLLGILGTSHDVGIFGPIYEITILAALASTAIALSTAPKISELILLNDFKLLNDFYKMISKWVLLVSLPLFLVIIIFADVLLLLFGGGFQEGTLPLRILGVAGAANIILGMSQTFITMSGKSNLKLINISLLYVTMFGLDWFFIPQWGLVGAALSTLVAAIVVSSLRFIQMHILFGINPFNYEYFKPFVAGGVAGIVTMILRHFAFAEVNWFGDVLLIAIFVCIYCSVVVSLKLSSEDRELIYLFSLKK